MNAVFAVYDEDEMGAVCHHVKEWMADYHAFRWATAHYDDVTWGEGRAGWWGWVPADGAEPLTWVERIEVRL